MNRRDTGQSKPVAWQCIHCGGCDKLCPHGSKDRPLFTAPQPAQEPSAWADKAMELATDFGVESLRLGSYEARNSGDRHDQWKIDMVRSKREAARERLRQHLYTPAAQRSQEIDDLTSLGGRLALELECLLLEGSPDTAAISKWWDSAHAALQAWRDYLWGRDGEPLANRMANRDGTPSSPTEQA